MSFEFHLFQVCVASTMTRLSIYYASSWPSSCTAL